MNISPTHFSRSPAIRSMLGYFLAWMAFFPVCSLAVEPSSLFIQAAGSVPTAQLPQASSVVQPLTKSDLRVLTADGSKLLDAQFGDLTGQGSAAALVVLEQPAGELNSGEGPPRTLLLVAHDAQGQLRTLAQNHKIVPCARCGGAAGDPYSYSRVEPGSFTVVTEGGSREHWWTELQFKYTPEIRDWILYGAVRGVTDTKTGRKKKINFSGKTLGTIKFTDFDPSSLPEVKLK